MTIQALRVFWMGIFLLGTSSRSISSASYTYALNIDPNDRQLTIDLGED